MTAYKEGLKGITVYREGSREGILITEKKDEKEAERPSANGEMEKAAVVEETRGSKAPRNRPGTTRGQTRRIRTGEGSLYITINEDENGLCEIFTTIGKAGGNAAAQSEAISRLISLALRSGIDPHAIVKQLKGISGPNPAWEDGRLVLSTPDAIGKALDDYLKDIHTGDGEEEHPSAQFTMVSEAETSGMPVTDYTFKNISVCPDCGSSVNHEGGCVTCPGCGFSKCE